MALLTWRAFNELINLSRMSSMRWSRDGRWKPFYLLLLSECCTAVVTKPFEHSPLMSLAIWDAVGKQYVRHNPTPPRDPNSYVTGLKGYYECKWWSQRNALCEKCIESCFFSQFFLTFFFFRSWGWTVSDIFVSWNPYAEVVQSEFNHMRPHSVCFAGFVLYT